MELFTQNWKKSYKNERRNTWKFLDVYSFQDRNEREE